MFTEDCVKFSEWTVNNCSKYEQLSSAKRKYRERFSGLVEFMCSFTVGFLSKFYKLYVQSVLLRLSHRLHQKMASRKFQNTDIYA